MALDVTSSGATTGTTTIDTSLSTTETPSMTMSSGVSTTTSSMFSSPSVQNKNGTIKNGYLTTNTFSRTTATTFGPLSPRHNLESSLTAKDIVLQLRQLAQDPHQQIHLIDNTESLRILSDSLLDTTTRSSTETCIFSLQTLQLLASNPNYRDTLKSIPNLNARIDALCLSAQQRLQINAKNLKTTLHSNTPLNKLQQWQPRPLHKIEFQISNLKTDNDRDEIQTEGIKINGITSVTVNMTSRTVTFYTTRENLRKQIALKLRANGFQVLAEDPYDDDIVSVHSGIGNFVDEQNKPRLETLMIQRSASDHQDSLRGVRLHRTHSKTSVIPERYASNSEDEAESKGDNGGNGASGGIFSLKGPEYVEPQIMNKSGITKYKPKHHVESLAQRLQHEQMMQEVNHKKEKQTQGFLNKLVSYVW